MQQQQLSELMQAAATDAVRYANEEHHITLDHSLDSLALVDSILSELHQRELAQQHSAEMIFTLCNMLGAYIGEVFIAASGGQWQQNKVDSTAPFIYVQYHDKEFPFGSVCYYKIMQDNAISLKNYVKQAMANAMQ
ncbi:hypothetical protein MN202_12895 [Rheinheimera muenzenbergensis]|uniref:DUF3806 domain-containing protein n=1 Tax=Rheinheimera muenzenbergensis TaxID=1193628 RepID=A0ABU8C847_9GAMM